MSNFLTGPSLMAISRRSIGVSPLYPEWLFAVIHRGSSMKAQFNLMHPCCSISLCLFSSSEGVGKSSLISTFVSRHFSEVVPGIMTRVRLPPDPDSSCITTIVDSQGGDAALMSAVAALSLSGGDSTNSLSSLQKSLSSSTGASNVGGIENVDSIILIYDLDRVETFFRLENHWLPLIERCYNGEVRHIRMQDQYALLWRHTHPKHSTHLPSTSSN
jgi:hypothetical protein